MAKRKLVIHTELKDLLLACWQRSPRLTLIIGTFIVVGFYDEIHGFITHHGTAYHLWESIHHLVEIFGPLIGG